MRNKSSLFRLLFLFIALILFGANTHAQDITNDLGNNGNFIVKRFSETYLNIESQLTLRSISLGFSNTATGIGSISIGNNSSTTATGRFSFAMGFGTEASGDYSFAIGDNTIASGNNSIAIGDATTTASGQNSIAIGDNLTASGDFSFAIGNDVSTDGYSGSFIIGDNSTSVVKNSTADNQMTMRFSGGYNLFTHVFLTTGVSLATGGSSWSSISDSTRKEKLVSADGEYFLNSLANLRLGSWNYKGQDPKEYRHYGPMAQEIFHYFGKDKYGVIGNDTTLATADMDGIIMISLQALEKRTADSQKRITELEKENEQLRVELKDLKDIKEEIAELKKFKEELYEQVKFIKANSENEDVKISSLNN